MILSFSEEVRTKAGENLTSFLTGVENFLDVCQEFAEKNKAVWVPYYTAKDWPFPHLFNHYVDIVLAVSLHKFSSLIATLIESVNRGNYLTYALMGRSMIEHAATLRYYWETRLAPIIQTASERGSLTPDERKSAVLSLDQLKDYRQLKESQASRRRQKRGAHSETRRENFPDQINVQTAIDHWAKAEPGIHIAYDLFCDLVHPNLGSNFLVMTRDEGRLRVDPQGASAVGFDIFRQSLPLLVSSAIREGARLIPLFAVIRYEDDELANVRKGNTR
jgi:hypothetical protein